MQQAKKGTTTVGIVGNDCVIVGAESKATLGNLVSSKEAQKVFKLDDIGEPDFAVIGIASSESDYRLTWALNVRLHFSFSLYTHVFNEFKHVFLVYRYLASEDLQYGLIVNKNIQGVLLKKWRTFDYLLRIQGYTDEAQLEQVKSCIWDLDMVSYCTVLKTEDLTSKQLRMISF